MSTPRKSVERDFPDPICRLDLSLTVLGQNPASLERTGEGQGRPCYEANFGRQERCAGCQADWVLRTGQATRWYLAVDTDAQTKSYFEITLIPERDEAGEITGLVEVLRDATLSFVMEHQLIATSEKLDLEVAERTAQLEALKRDQAALVQAEKMASLGRLVAGLTHEIHTPLGTIVSSLGLLRSLVERIRRTPGDLELLLEQTGEMLDLEELASQRIARILRSMREFAHLDRAEEEAADLHRGIDACLALLSHELKGRIEVTLDYGELPLVVCRPDAMNQVFMNLLQNAVQAIDGPGWIRIETRAEVDNWVRLEFHDSGRGIEPDHIEQIFDPGFTTKPRGVGTGLGLALSYNTLATHQGEITVKSTPGEGSVFTLRLPVLGVSS